MPRLSFRATKGALASFATGLAELRLRLTVRGVRMKIDIFSDTGQPRGPPAFGLMACRSKRVRTGIRRRSAPNRSCSGAQAGRVDVIQSRLRCSNARTALSRSARLVSSLARDLGKKLVVPRPRLARAYGIGG